MKAVIFTLFLMIVISFVIFKIKGRNKNTNAPLRDPVNVKYEIVTSAPVVNDSISANWAPYLYYTDSSGNYIKANIFTSGTNWNRTITLRTGIRPLFMHLLCSLRLSDSGSVKMNIYVNDKLQTSESIPTESADHSIKNCALAGVAAYVQ